MTNVTSVASVPLRVTSPALLLAAAWFSASPCVSADTTGAGETEEEIVVTGVRPAAEGEISGSEVAERARSSLGATLEETLGVSNASFGAGVGLPVIRGLQGSRVYVSINGTGSHDASTLSPDHAIPIEPLLADKIRVRRGPAAILFGGSAIGGAVEIDDGRIPRQRPDTGTSLVGEVRYETALEEFAAIAKADHAIGPVVAHFGGFARDRNTLRIPGRALDEAAIRDQFGLTDLHNSDGIVANSEGESRGGNLGASLIRDWGLAGVALTQVAYEYGIPPGGHPAHSHGNQPAPSVTEEVRIDLDQSRLDTAVELDDPLPSLNVQKLELRGAFVDYTHDELEQGVAVTTFDNDARELRLDLTHGTSANVTTHAGMELLKRDFSAVGAEVFVPPLTVRSRRVFALSQLERAYLNAEIGWRWETHETLVREPDRIVGGIAVPLPASIEYGTMSLSAALAVRPWNSVSIRLSTHQAERAPEIQEMLALGPHLATRSFDVGNLALTPERSTAVELGMSVEHQRAQIELSVFNNRMRNFIYQENQGFFFDLDEQLFRQRCVRLEQCLPVFGYRQQDAQFHGAEGRIKLPFGGAPPGSSKATLDLFADYSRGKFRESAVGDVPRQPAARAGIEFEYVVGDWSGRLRWMHAFEQRHPGLNETPTDDYDLLNVSIQRAMRMGEFTVHCHATARNLLDAEIRNSVSFLRSFAPEPGRSLEIGVRVSR